MSGAKSRTGGDQHADAGGISHRESRLNRLGSDRPGGCLPIDFSTLPIRRDASEAFVLSKTVSFQSAPPSSCPGAQAYHLNGIKVK